MKKHFTYPKITKKDVVLVGTGLFSLIVAILLIAFTLTFVIKKINLILRAPSQTSKEIHFNISEAKKLFPSITTAPPSAAEIPSTTSASTISTTISTSTATSSTP